MALFFKRKPKHQIKDIVSISISCCHMDSTYCYSFGLYKEDKWYFDCECFIKDFMEKVEIERMPISNDEVNMALDIIREKDLIYQAEKFKKIDSPFFTTDETTYTFILRFSDNMGKATTLSQSSLETLFYDLVKKYYKGEIEK